LNLKIFNVFLDPELGFWAITDDELPDELKEFKK